MTIQSFDKASATAFQKEAAAALKALAAKHGVELTKNSGRYTGEQFTINVEFKTQTMVRRSLRLRSAALIKGCKLNGITLTQKFRDHNGTIHTLVDYNGRAYKTPFITTASNGKSYRWAAESIRHLQKYAV